MKLRLLRPFSRILVLLLLLLSNRSWGQPTDTGSILWEISGNGLKKPSYLYGTIHIQDKRAFNFTPEMLKAFKKSKSFAMELIPDASSSLTLMAKMQMKGKTLKDLYTPERYHVLDSIYLAQTKTPLSLLASYKPFIAYSLIAQSKFKSDMKEALDLYLLKEAKSQKKNVHGLETMEEQMGAILAIPDSTQAEMLWDSAMDTTGDNSETEQMLRLYESGDLHAMEEKMREESMGPEFEEGLVTKRNHNMADRMEPLIRREPTFTAVGALHLPGEEGVINLLRRKGYTVEPVITAGR